MQTYPIPDFLTIVPPPGPRQPRRESNDSDDSTEIAQLRIFQRQLSAVIQGAPAPVARPAASRRLPSALPRVATAPSLETLAEHQAFLQNEAWGVETGVAPRSAPSLEGLAEHRPFLQNEALDDLVTGVAPSATRVPPEWLRREASCRVAAEESPRDALSLGWLRPSAVVRRATTTSLESSAEHRPFLQNEAWDVEAGVAPSATRVARPLSFLEAPPPGRTEESRPGDAEESPRDTLSPGSLQSSAVGRGEETSDDDAVNIR